jgi:hypothetical protein
MPDVNEVYQSEFLRAAQLQGQPRRVTIESAGVEVLGQGEKAQQKIVLKFSRVKQRLPLNKTNAVSLSGALGPMTDSWIGCVIELRPEKVMFSGAMVDSIRVHAVPEAKKGPPHAAPSVPAPTPGPAGPTGDAPEQADEWPDEMVDDIPWDDK